MGWKYPSSTTPAQRRLLRLVERDPFFKPRSTAAKKRYTALIEKGLIEVLSARTGKAKVNLEVSS